MSTATARKASPAPVTRRPAPPPALHVVATPPWRAPLAPFILVSVVVVVTGLLSLLALNTLVAQDSFRVQELERSRTDLREREQLLNAEVARQQAPAALAIRARALGLVPGNTPAFVRLRDGRIIGVAVAAIAPLPVAQAPAVGPPVGTAVTTTANAPVAMVPAPKAPAVKAPAVTVPAAHAATGKVPAVKVPAVKAPAVKAPAVKAPSGNAPVGKAPVATVRVTKPPVAGAARTHPTPPKPATAP